MPLKNPFRSARGSRQAAAGVLGLALALGLGACSNLLDVDYPGRIPSGQIDNPELADVLARSVVSDLECAYSNYTGGSAVQSDEYETSNSNVPLANWGERTISADEDAYVLGNCENAFGIQLTIQTARFQSEDIYTRLSNWTDAQVPNRTKLMATVRAYGGYAYTFMGETWCKVAFDGGAVQDPSAALDLAADRFGEAITLAQQAGDQDILDMARVGLARVQLDLKQYAAAEATAAQVTPGYVKYADRGSENTRRFNDVFYYATQLGAYTISNQLRAIDDPRLLVRDTGGGAFNPTIELWVTDKYTGTDSPIRLASSIEAQLIRAEALAQQGQLQPAMDILNARRSQLGLADLTAADQTEAIDNVLAERRVELAFEGGHRLADLLRYQLPWKGANGSTQVSNPFTARPYGQTTCWPHPTKETNGA